MHRIHGGGGFPHLIFPNHENISFPIVCRLLSELNGPCAADAGCSLRVPKCCLLLLFHVGKLALAGRRLGQGVRSISQLVMHDRRGSKSGWGMKLHVATLAVDVTTVIERNSYVNLKYVTKS